MHQANRKENENRLTFAISAFELWMVDHKNRIGDHVNDQAIFNRLCKNYAYALAHISPHFISIQIEFHKSLSHMCVTCAQSTNQRIKFRFNGMENQQTVSHVGGPDFTGFWIYCVQK